VQLPADRLLVPDREKADAGKKAFIVNRIGDFGFLVAMFLIFANLGALDFVTVFEAAPATFAYGGAVVTVITLFLFLGAWARARRSRCTCGCRTPWPARRRSAR
jgi:NADH:ubiquinone oxidoreductase subunit 5 (subunit L)/multisubunit Na+/H+ antiporter MnhA subunit